LNTKKQKINQFYSELIRRGAEVYVATFKFLNKKIPTTIFMSSRVRTLSCTGHFMVLKARDHEKSVIELGLASVVNKILYFCISDNLYALLQHLFALDHVLAGRALLSF
jgi:hypothetical protein